MLFYDGNLTKRQIRARTGFSEAQIRRTLASGRATPGFNSRGRYPYLSDAETDQLIKIVISSKAARRMTYNELAKAGFNDRYGTLTIRNAVHRRGYRRYLARRKPPPDELDRRRRLEWAQQHADWTPDQWRQNTLD